MSGTLLQGLLVTADNLTLEEGYNKQKFNVTNFNEVLSCVEVIAQECQKYRDTWTCTPVGADLSESMQDLLIEKMPSSIRQGTLIKWGSPVCTSL